MAIGGKTRGGGEVKWGEGSWMLHIAMLIMKLRIYALRRFCDKLHLFGFLLACACLACLLLSIDS
jgi:hypothetical protein